MPKVEIKTREGGGTAILVDGKDMGHGCIGASLDINVSGKHLLTLRIISNDVTCDIENADFNVIPETKPKQNSNRCR